MISGFMLRLCISEMDSKNLLWYWKLALKYKKFHVIF